MSCAYLISCLGSSSLSSCSASKATKTFRTNNQEAAVDEADVVQSDGNFLYAAYADVLLAWDITSGEIVANITMPAIEFSPYTIVYSMTGEAIPRNNNTRNGTMNQNISSDDAFSLYGDMYDSYYKPKAQIQSLLLTDNRLAVVITGYGETSQQYPNPNVKPKIIDSSWATRLQIYDTSALVNSDGKLMLLNETDINGMFLDGCVVGNNVHLVTVVYVSTYSLLVTPLYRWHPTFVDLSKKEYVLAAIKLAEEKLIPTFVDQLVEEMFVNGNIDLVRVSLLQSQLSNSTDTDQYMYGQGILNSLTQVVSFDMSDTLSNNLMLSIAGAFLPSNWGNIYATEEMLLVTAEGYDWDLSLGNFGQTTYLLGFKLDGSSSTPYAVGSIDGYVMSQHSVDIHEEYLRLATAIVSEMPTNKTYNEAHLYHQVMDTQNYITILKIPSNANDTLGELKVVGRTESLGKEGEVFAAARFFDNIAYCVTFRTIDPFYVVNLTDPLNPKAVGVLENVTGFNSYLYSMNSANTVMMAVGQEVDATNGILTGIQLTMFDASDPIKPVTLQRYVVETDKDGYSSSIAVMDYKAFRFLSLGDESGIVIIPLTIVGGWYESPGDDDAVTNGTNFDTMHNGDPQVFDGFVVFDVNKTSITERIRIPHVDTVDMMGCYPNYNLQPKSFASAGDIMTLKGHTVVSTDLDTGNQNWNLTLPVSEVPNGCLYSNR